MNMYTMTYVLATHIKRYKWFVSMASFRVMLDHHVFNGILLLVNALWSCDSR